MAVSQSELYTGREFRPEPEILTPNRPKSELGPIKWPEKAQKL